MTYPLDHFGLPSDVLVWRAILLMFVAFAVGLLGGFVGLALGTMRLPALLLLGIPTPLAASTNIIVSAASSLIGGVRHLKEGRVDWRVVLVMGVPSLVGGFIGGFGSHRVPEAALLFAVGVLVTWQGVEFVATARRAVDDTGLGDRARLAGTYRAPAEAVVGFGIGALGGAVGLILGSLRIPALIRLFGMDPRIATGTNLLVGFMVGSMGWLGHLARGDVDYPLVVAMGSTAIVGSYIGARQTGRVSRNSLVMTLGIVLVVVGVLLLFRSVT